MRGNVTDYQAKKAFATLNALCPGISPLYIDEYWDNNIESIGETERWEKFLYDFKKSGLTFTSYKEELNRMTGEYNKYIIKNLKHPGELYLQIYQLNSEIINDEFLQLYKDLPDAGKYICVDIHSAWDMALKKADLLNESYDANEIIKKITSNDIFYNKDARIWMYRYTINNHRNIPINLFNICNVLILKEIFNSDEPAIKHLNENYELAGCKGDSILYKINDNDDYKNLLGEYKYKDISYHIMVEDIKDIEIFGKPYRGIIFDDKLFTIYNSTDQTKNVHPYFVKKLLNQEITDLDRAVGYEDEIFFFIDE